MSMNLPTWKSQIIKDSPTATTGTVNEDRYNTGFKGNNNTLVTPVNELAAELLNMDPEPRKQLAQLLKNAGYNVPITGNYNKTLADAYTDAFYKALEQSQQTGTPITTINFLAQEYAARKGLESADRPNTVIAERTFTKEQSETLIQETISKLLGRDATKKEVSSLTKKLNKALKENPSKTTYKTINGKSYQTTTPGLDAEDFILDNIVATKEYKQREQTAPDLLRRVDEKRIFENAIKGRNPEEIESISLQTEYGRGVEDTKARIREAIVEIGGTATDEEIAGLATQVYDRAIEGNPSLVRKLIRDTIKVEPGLEPGGDAGKNLAELKKTAAANGLDIDKNFGSEVQTWLRSINEGESIDTFKKAIRDVAKIGMPQNVAGLLDRGVDLETIYSPYKKVMATTLDLNPETISMDDPTLRAAIGPDREMSVYDFQKALRQDKRWEFSEQARNEVSTLVNRVLKDFGFVG